MSAIEAALFGTLSRDCERKTSKNGNTYLRLNIACESCDATTWVGAMVFDERAIAVADRLVKGARVYVEGRLSLNEWTTSEGEKRVGLNIMSWHCRLAAIGRNKPKRDTKEREFGTPQTAAAGSSFDDPVDDLEAFR